MCICYLHMYMWKTPRRRIITCNSVPVPYYFDCFLFLLRSSSSSQHADIANGYPCFVISISAIGVCTAVIGDIAGHLGCFIFLKDSVNAIAFVALGTSVPGSFIQQLVPTHKSGCYSSAVEGENKPVYSLICLLTSSVFSVSQLKTRRRLFCSALFRIYPFVRKQIEIAYTSILYVSNDLTTSLVFTNIIQYNYNIVVLPEW